MTKKDLFYCGISLQENFWYFPTKSSWTQISPQASKFRPNPFIEVKANIESSFSLILKTVPQELSEKQWFYCQFSYQKFFDFLDKFWLRRSFSALKQFLTKSSYRLQVKYLIQLSSKFQGCTPRLCWDIAILLPDLQGKIFDFLQEISSRTSQDKCRGSLIARRRL